MAVVTESTKRVKRINQKVEQWIGPGRTEIVYELKFNQTNAKGLLDKRLSDKVQFAVKDEESGRTVEVEYDVNINKTFERFMKPFDYLMDSNWMTPQQKADALARDIGEGLSICAPQQVASIGNPAPKGAYS